jgi:hypothetical protein
MKEKEYEVISITKDYLIRFFRGNEKAIYRISEMTDEEIQELANRLRNKLMESEYWRDTIETEFESRFLLSDKFK